MPAPPSVRVVIRLPWDRPEDPLVDPPPIEWNAEKADSLWKVIERSRSSDSGGPDWKGLAARLQVPLPYLLYRVNARFQEDIRGLKDIQGALSPSSTQPPKPLEAGLLSEKSPTAIGRTTSRLNTSSRFSSSSRLLTPVSVRARLNSLGNNSPKPKKATSSSTITVQAQKKTHAPLRPTTPSSSEGSDSEDEAARKEEDADRDAEEQEALDRKLQQLQAMMTNDALGLVGSVHPRSKGKSIDRGRPEPRSPRSMVGSYRQDALSSRSASHSVSSASSPQGSIPDIPSPPSDSQPHSPIPRRFSATKSSSPPALSPRSALGQRYRPLVDRAMSEHSSSHGSEASSFSDLSDASLSASALESALMSNIRGGGSRLSQYARSRMSGRAL